MSKKSKLGFRLRADPESGLRPQRVAAAPLLGLSCTDVTGSCFLLLGRAHLFLADPGY